CRLFIFFGKYQGEFFKIEHYPDRQKIVLLGLENAGRTTLLHRLKAEQFGDASPLASTSRFLSRMVKFDVGGPICRDLIPDVIGVVFMIDSSDHDRIEEAKSALDTILIDEQLAGAPVVVLANKADKEGTMNEAEVKERLGLQQMCTGKAASCPDQRGRLLEVFSCSVEKKQGYLEALRWLELCFW
ncbi:hypothetical protein PFISCL1PPCAC_13290, partial [Pristionchus fissidentatus]